MSKTYKAPKWLADLIEETENEVNKVLEDCGRSLFWFDKAKPEARVDFLKSLEEKEREKAGKALDLLDTTRRYVLVKWNWENQEKFPRGYQYLHYDTVKKELTVSRTSLKYF